MVRTRSIMFKESTQGLQVIGNKVFNQDEPIRTTQTLRFRHREKTRTIDRSFAQYVWRRGICGQ